MKLFNKFVFPVSLHGQTKGERGEPSAAVVLLLYNKYLDARRDDSG